MGQPGTRVLPGRDAARRDEKPPKRRQVRTPQRGMRTCPGRDTTRKKRGRPGEEASQQREGPAPLRQPRAGAEWNGAGTQELHTTVLSITNFFPKEILTKSRGNKT